jgi:hypothetical protein
VNEQYNDFHFQNLKTIIQKFKSSIEKRLVKLYDLESRRLDANKEDTNKLEAKSQSNENLHQEKWESDLINAQDAYKISADDPMGKLYN